jgi:hypothetical protein
MEQIQRVQRFATELQDVIQPLIRTYRRKYVSRVLRAASKCAAQEPSPTGTVRVAARARPAYVCRHLNADSLTPLRSCADGRSAFGLDRGEAFVGRIVVN